MRNLLALPVLFALLLIPTGCSTLTEGDIGLLAADLRDVGREGTIYALAERPEWRTQIELVRDNLNKLAEQPSITIDGMLQILSTLPFEELQSSEARLAFTGGRIILRRVGANVDLSSVQNLKPLAAGLALGIDEGLALQKKLKL